MFNPIIGVKEVFLEVILDLKPLLYIGIILVVGGALLYLRRKAKGTRASYKISLILLGVLLSTFIFSGIIESGIVRLINILMLIIFTLELSIRFNSENIKLRKNLKIFSSMILLNIIILTFIAMMLFRVHPMYAIVFAILMTSVEYFLVDELKEEGDLGNPLIILFVFSIIYFFNLQGTEVLKAADMAQHIVIGLGTGIIIGLLTYKIMKSQKINWIHELGLISMAIIGYTVGSSLGGSGILSVMVIGIMYGNSHLRKKRYLQTLPDFVYKPLEILLYLMMGFVVPLIMDVGVMWKAATLFLVYSIIRITVLRAVHKHYSWHNIVLLTFGPKGMTYALVLMVLTNYIFPGQLIGAMFWILIYSMFISLIIENIEERKIKQIDKLFAVLKKLRYGRKQDLHKTDKKVKA